MWFDWSHIAAWRLAKDYALRNRKNISPLVQASRIACHRRLSRHILLRW